jgi:hypothetical protein
MHGLVAASCPAGALLDALNEHGMVGATNYDCAPTNLLEVTIKTQVGVAGGEEPGVDGSVGRVTDRTPFAHGLVFEYVRAALRGVAPKAGFTRIEQRHAAAGVNRALVWEMTVRAAELPSGAGWWPGRLN